MAPALPPIPAKRYFTIGDVGDLCDVKPHVLRYWEQEFTQLRPMKRRGNRRYYQHHEVLMIRRIRELLYDQGFTISGARNKLHELQTGRDKPTPSADGFETSEMDEGVLETMLSPEALGMDEGDASRQLMLVRRELCEIRDLLAPTH